MITSNEQKLKHAGDETAELFCQHHLLHHLVIQSWTHIKIMYYPLARQTQHTSHWACISPQNPSQPTSQCSHKQLESTEDIRPICHLWSSIPLEYITQNFDPALWSHRMRRAISFLNLNCCSLWSQTFFSLITPLTYIQLTSSYKTLKLNTSAYLNTSTSAYQLLQP